MTENSRWDLPELEVKRYLEHSYDHIVDLLVRFDHSSAYQLDPSGDAALRRAKQVRRDALRTGGAGRVHDEAERHFGLPLKSLGYLSKLEGPLYEPSRSANS